MNKGLNRVLVAQLASLCVLLVAMMASPAALAQGGRAAQGRGSSAERVERKSVQNKKAVSKEKPAARSRATARTVERRRSGKPEAGRSGKDRVARAGTRLAQPDTDRKTRGRQVIRGESGSERRTPSDRLRDGARGDRRGADRYDGNRPVSTSRTNRVAVTDGRRSRYTGPRYDRVKPGRHAYAKRDRFYYHTRRHRPQYAWCTAYHHPGHVHYVDSHIHVGSHLYLGISWPWEVRFRAHWRPRFRYRQVVYVETGWSGQRRRSEVEVHTYYRHRVLFANDRYSEVEIEVDAIDIYQNGRYLSTVDRIPGSLSKVRAVIHGNGRIEFDRNLFLIGDLTSGFEVLATRYYTDHLYNAYDRGHGFRVGRVDLRRGKVVSVRHSRFFDRGRFIGYAPISLLPDDDRLWDYGRPASYNYDERRRDDDRWYRGYRDYEPRYEDDYERSRDYLDSYSTGDGGEVRLERATVLDRLD